MIRIFPDFSVQVTASAAGGAGAGGGGGGGGGGGMVTGPPVGRVPVPVPGATNGTPQSVQGITAYQQRSSIGPVVWLPLSSLSIHNVSPSKQLGANMFIHYAPLSTSPPFDCSQ
ncbi:neuronal PAS domain-containing protein 3 [Lates japonicus]|uniref:Neuronal PAS domain-containing protein 3 n=1 Tax=Lates japonicus TaxID=270547 RepID=A0AAD3NHW9_LATJO|nr:neuronal PAS domain-containing protein 3 [Lates japonicus]